MCTLGAKKIKGEFLIFKTRDRERGLETQIIKRKGAVKKLLVIDQKGHCEGINEHGIGIIEATLRPFPYIKHHHTPSRIASKILDQENMKDALNIIKKAHISGNMILSDGNIAYIVESTPYEYADTRIKSQGVITNLSVKLNKKNGYTDEIKRDHAKGRYKRAKELIKKIVTIEDIKALLSDTKGAPKSICRREIFGIATRCAYIYDLKNRKIFFCKNSPDQGGDFKEYKL